MLNPSAKHCKFCVIFQHYKNSKWEKGLFGFLLYHPVSVPCGAWGGVVVKALRY